MLRAKNIHKIYNNGNKKLHVLKGLDFNIEKGKIISVVGPSGAGKSTLLHLLGGLDEPSEGKIFIDDYNLYKLSDRELSRIRNERFGFVFQFYHLLSEFTVLENIFLPAMIKFKASPFKLNELKERAIDFLKRVKLRDKADSFPNQLSGGEQQRIAICRSLMNNPEVLFCDEPTGNLDSRCGEEIIGLIKDLNAENKMAAVLVTHNEQLAKIADNVFHLKDGVLVS
jgi:lipoprotein-releasing system ATP-binding protein